MQCQLARLRNNDPARSELQEREGYLLSVARCGEWDEPLRALGASPSSYERGFPTVVAMPAEDFLRHGEEVLRHVPRPTAYLTVGSGDTAQLARSPLLAGLRGLGIEHEGVTEGDAQAIATSPHLKQLTRLTLPNNHIRDDGAINLTHAGLQRHRVLWVREMTEEEIRQVGEKGPTIDSIQVAEFESHDVLKEWLKEKAPAFLPRTTAG